jgi:hypothetical protein
MQMVQTLIAVTLVLGCLVALGFFGLIVLPNRRERRTHDQLFNEYRRRRRVG